MKAASLGFVTPGMRVKYGLTPRTIALLPFVALTGTTVGSFVWGALADIYGRRAAILLAAVMFVGTSICGAMPSFAWNIFMCFMMGLAAGAACCLSPMCCSPRSCRPNTEVGVWCSWAASERSAVISQPANYQLCFSRISAGELCG